MTDAEDADGAQNEPTRTRVTVQRDTTRVRGLRPVRELAERTPVGDAYLRALMRTQLALALRLLVLLFSVLAGVPLLLLLDTKLRVYRVAGIPIGWLVIGGAFYPVFILFGAVYVRRAERNEAEFVELVKERDASNATRR